MIILIIQRNSWNSFFLRSSNDSKIFLIALTRSKGHHLAILIPVINFSRYNGNINPPKKNMLSILLLSFQHDHGTITVRSRDTHTISQSCNRNRVKFQIKAREERERSSITNSKLRPLSPSPLNVSPCSLLLLR